MKQNIKSLLLLTVAGLFTLGLASCGEDSTKSPDGITLGTNLKGAVTKASKLEAGKEYKLKGTLSVKDGATLTIPAGVKIVADPGFDKYIIVEQGGKIFVNGTSDKPVIMTCSSKNAGAWGGLILNGKAPLTSSQTTANVEIDPTLKYGGTNAGDNSGSISYLILEYTGNANNDDVEHNALTLNGVGNGTKISNIFAYKGADDGIEFFGGTVSVDGFLSVDCDDDMFDVTQGWHGTLSNAYGVWSASHTSTEKDPRGVEADGNHDGNFKNDTNQSTFTINNITIELQKSPSQVKGDYMDDVFKIRRGAIATINNAYVFGTGLAKDFIDTTDGRGDGTLTIEYNNALSNDCFGKLVSGTATTKENKSLKGTPRSYFSWTGYFK